VTITQLTIVILSSVIASGSAGADPAGDKLRQFGLIGTWAYDCNEPASPGNPHVTFTVPPSGSPVRLLRTGVATLDGITQIDGAHAVNNKRLEMSWTLSGIKFQTVIEIAGERLRAVESIGSDGGTYIRDGKFTGTACDTQWFSRCSNETS
jgi:hypothetical protein